MRHDTVIRVQNVCKSFDGLLVLKDISFEMQRGEVLVMCGPSGCGKSTLLRCINGLEKVDSGQIWVNELPVHGSSHKELMKIRLRVGIVFQNFNLFPHMTAIRNISLAPIKILGQNKKQAKENAMQLLEMVGISDKANSYPCVLSGGQRQRLAIARALAMKPEIMLFDEPTSALDPEMIEEVLDVIRRLSSDEKMTMIIVTHEIGFAKEIADKAMLLEDTGIVETSDARVFFENPRHQRTKEFIRSILTH